MKKILVCLAALVLLMATVAMAEVQVEAILLERSVNICKATNCYVNRAADGYHLYDEDGNVLSAAYKSITVKQNGYYLEVQNESNSVTLNCLGLLDAQGREILPLEYGDFSIIEPDWVLAYVLGPAEGDVGEYKDSQGNKYIVTRTDVVYKGKIIGSMGREDYIKSYSVGAAGSYLFVKRDSTHMYWLDGSFNRMDVEAKDFVATKEFSEIYKKGVFHNPTQQYAFVAGCTLTPDQVDQSIWLDADKGTLLDLQGNVIASGLKCDYVYYRGNYFVIKKDGLCGIIDFQGNEIVPMQYKEIAYHDDGMFLQGYNALVDEKGRLSYVDVNGTITASVDYELSYSDYKGFGFNAPIVAVKNMGKYTLISATHGELPGKYDDVLTPAGTNSFIAVQKDGLWGIVDMAGEVVVPFELRWGPTISADGSLITGSTEAREYFLYKVTSSSAAAPSVPESWTEVKTSGEDVDTTPVLAEGAWECTCGVITNGKFCPECGSKKPEATATPEPTATPAPAVDDGSWTCDCGSVNAGKFCPECGAKKPEATPVPTATPEPQCVSCGYKPEGATPKFCPECGTKF